MDAEIKTKIDNWLEFSRNIKEKRIKRLWMIEMFEKNDVVRVEITDANGDRTVWEGKSMAAARKLIENHLSAHGDA